ncbi:anthranilate phosphoribosyltransferase [Gluconacetobacter diazotrophicus PA1 5]|uniref:Anthranilate phosphoribosyltransferase n=2 Tax=Gluconacetobacter diazotrophicus TaxID=33996 RepID=A9HJ97_GLUDA|nr:anthranilate phosphoribosyltransferase [Gluconacetobacter diazotrophicus]ACI49958.1 anthranilate phosphoribosyltransferase [Gluconacetobacter diazotrophicus PA1 5]MBB2156509.1 anthranilate phosphoribosyltransferase [Gluconacetobacter diazotrophicus]TWB06002.1 anthranilate phosphoribosyltransferase [Gluconacetobacter diazotrophicus]CAP55879.1 putative anthranilate phosphoribosyltransferase [Gluconacetobacter diazotrophicus PA1 5]
MDGVPSLSADQAGAFRTILNRLARGETLTETEAEDAFGLIMDGGVPDTLIAAFLMALRVRGEKRAELLGAVRAVRSRMRAVGPVPPGTIDVCGTGGDGLGTLNISTAVAFVLAALGVPVAKHGNRALSSRSGATDVLGALGVDLSDDPSVIAARINDGNLAFMAAPAHHPAMRHAGPVRAALGIRTLFNLIGPLCNPAGVTHQLVGVFDPAWLRPVVETLQLLGSERVWAVHGYCEGATGGRGVDELTLAGPTAIVALQNGRIYDLTLRPEDAGLRPAPITAIAGGGAEENAAALTALLAGAHGAYRDTVLLNAAACLHVAGRGAALDDDGRLRPASLRALVADAARVLDDGSALAMLNSARRRHMDTPEGITQSL